LAAGAAGGALPQPSRNKGPTYKGRGREGDGGEGKGRGGEGREKGRGYLLQGVRGDKRPCLGGTYGLAEGRYLGIL